MDLKEAKAYAIAQRARARKMEAKLADIQKRSRESGPLTPEDVRDLKEIAVEVFGDRPGVAEGFAALFDRNSTPTGGAE